MLKRTFTVSFVLLLASIAAAGEISSLVSPDGNNKIILLNSGGSLSFAAQRNGRAVVEQSALGLVLAGEDLSTNLTVEAVSEQRSSRQKYSILVGNRLDVDSELTGKTITLKSASGTKFDIELAASNDGVAFRYILNDSAPQTILSEKTAFKIPAAANCWLQPYHAAGPYTPAYEDFFFNVDTATQPPVSRDKPRGWCMPAMFMLGTSCTLLVTETGTENYCNSHLEPVKERPGLYNLEFAYEDEITEAKKWDSGAKKGPVSASKTPWRVVIMASSPKELAMSTLITDLAEPCRIEDTSWIQTGRASWSWWSNNDGKATKPRFDSFTDLAADYKWEYTLFDAGWWTPGLSSIADYAKEKNVKSIAWCGAGDFYTAERRNRKFDEMQASGVAGVKIDFWCSDRQQAVEAMLATLEEAAKRKLVINFHGCTIPRGWQRTWPNLLTAEAVLGTESYFYEPRYPARAAEQNTILPLTRNLMAPMDITPFALTGRKYMRQTSAAHELASAVALNSGIIHFADSVAVFNDMPSDVRRVLSEAPASWDETICLEARPGKIYAVARRSDEKWFVAGLTAAPANVNIDLAALGEYKSLTVITEGAEPLMTFNVKKTQETSRWRGRVPESGGFVLILE
jgi:hypothetical protein